MTISVAQFRADLPEFSGTTMYPNSGVQFWLNFAYRMINSDRFLSETDIGAELFTAHFITLEARNVLESAGGGIPGSNVGALSSKSVDRVSVSYDTGAGTEQGAGHWNLTTYGTRFIWMCKIFGAGPIQLGIGTAPSGLGYGEPWPGPDMTPHLVDLEIKWHYRKPLK